MSSIQWLPAVLLCAAVCGPAAAQTADGDDDVYAKQESWLCRPDQNALCSTPTEVTEIAPDSTLHVVTHPLAKEPGIDCFYVYPTVSADKTANSSMVAGPEVKRVVQAQLAPFASACRPFAPIYRQVTVAGLESALHGGALHPDTEIAYQDVLSAWRSYLRHDNHGRGVVLIGHSQGSHVLARLIAQEIDGQAIQSQLVAAILPGMNVEVPEGADVGGTFQHVPLCRSASQRGCVVSYVSFRAETPPPPRARFGRSDQVGMVVACTDPALLSGHPLSMMLPVTLMGLDGAQAWASAYVNNAQTARNTAVTTPFFAAPGLVQVRCVQDNHGSYLAVTSTAQPGDKRPADIPGDLVVRGHTAYTWGLHLIDLNLLMGNLIDFVAMHDPAH